LNGEDMDAVMRELPESVRQQVLDYLEFLLTRHRKKDHKSRSFRFDWEGGLSNLSKEFTSVELQHKALEWR